MQWCPKLSVGLLLLFHMHEITAIYGLHVFSFDVFYQAFERIKLIQLAKYHAAKTEEAKSRIICSPQAIFYEAFKNCRPNFVFLPYIKGGVIYSVSLGNMIWVWSISCHWHIMRMLLQKFSEQKEEKNSRRIDKCRTCTMIRCTN